MNYNEWFEKELHTFQDINQRIALTHVVINTQEFLFDYGLISFKN